MKKTLFLLVLIVGFCGQIFAQGLIPVEPEKIADKSGKKASDKNSFEISVGSFNFPGALLEKQGDLVAHPKKLSGFATGFSLKHRLGQSTWSLGPEFSLMSASGSGEWARSDTQERLDYEGVAGTTTGTLKLRIYSFAFVVKKKFCRGSICPFLEFGGGAGKLYYDFRGRFNGHETQSGYDFPVNELARDKSSRTIPVFVFRPGISLKQGRFSFTGAPYWNTGWGASGTVTINLGKSKKF